MSQAILTITGFVGNDPEIREVNTRTGSQKVARFNLAVNYGRRDEQKVQWFRISVWGENQVEVVRQFVRKGKEVQVTSFRVEVSPYFDRDGGAAASLEVRADRIHLVGKRDERDDSGSYASVPAEGELVDIPF